ncbi:LLM class flavin-dependent oxidoreductase [Halobacteriaceae archaeon GCM10025711]
MHVGLLLPPVEEPSPTDLATRAEALGYDSVWLGELWGTDAFVTLADVAARTDSVTIGTAIVNVFSRTPAALAQAAATVDRVADGRMVLGVGTSTPTAVENIHGMAFDRPVRRAHETIAIAKRLLGGDDRVTYDGELLSVDGVPPLDADVPVYHAALGPANRRVVGRLADGWIPHNVPFPDLGDAFETVAETAEEAGRDPDAIEVAPYVPAAVSDDPGEARDAIRGHLAYYVGSGEGYRRAVAGRFPDQADRIAAAWQDGEHGEAAGHVTDSMIDALGVAGTPEMARDQLRDLADHPVIDRPLLTVPNQAAADLAEETMEALAPSEL